MQVVNRLAARFNALSVTGQSFVIIGSAVLGADLLTLVFYSIFFADRLLLDLFLTSVIVVAIGSPLTFFFMGRSARIADLAAELDRANRVDDLTQVLNRKTFLREATSLINAEAGDAGTGTLLFIDVDHFKHVNDTLGHAKGDAVLRAVGSMLRTSIRDGDLVGRFGGEEFTVFLQKTSQDTALEICERIRSQAKAISRDLDLGALQVTVSIGVATRAPGQDLDNLLTAADRNLYAAKAGGRDRSVHTDVERRAA